MRDIEGKNSAAAAQVTVGAGGLWKLVNAFRRRFLCAGEQAQEPTLGELGEGEV
ncbi:MULTISPECIES: hypothetical protein [unclassified Thiocapsa]|uniref:hypothetical protein n=1 Tax=unclassified Thiocapsa TaxID=2641286 RepID=UPI0035AFDC1E